MGNQSPDSNMKNAYQVNPITAPLFAWLPNQNGKKGHASSNLSKSFVNFGILHFQEDI